MNNTKFTAGEMQVSIKEELAKQGHLVLIQSISIWLDFLNLKKIVLLDGDVRIEQAKSGPIKK